MKYYIIVTNNDKEILGVFETFDDAVKYIESGPKYPSFYNIKLIPKKGI